MSIKTVIITGGSSGIGEAIVEKYSLNHYVYNLDIVENQKFNSMQNYSYLKVDVTKEDEIISAINFVKNEKEILNVLIACAGMHKSANIESTTNSMLYDILNLNLLGVFWLIKHALPLMKNNGGSIITIGSDQSTISKYNSAVYGMTKAALLSLTRSTALDYAKYNIRANCIGAGTIDTPLYRSAIQRYSEHSGIQLEDIEQDEAKEQPLGRVGLATEVAALAYFLSQDEVSYITGALIPIDGGYIAK